MITGVETAGLVLAIVPLVLTALEHHKAVFEVVNASLKYTKRAQKACQDFGVVSAELQTALRLVAKDCGLTESQYASVFALPHSGNGRSDADGEAKERLIDHFGTAAYETGLKPLLDRILESLQEIGNDIGLKLKLNPTLWSSIEAAKSWLKRPASERMDQKDEYCNRFKLFLKAGTLESREARLSADVQRLRNMREDAKELGSIVSRRMKFNQDIDSVQVHAKVLYRAMCAVSACTRHTSHCIGLRLDRRIKHSNSTKDKQAKEDSLAFTVALATSIDAKHWHLVTVNTQAVEAPPQKVGRHVRFAAGQAPFPAPWKNVDHGVCASIAESSDVLFSIDSKERLREKPADAGKSVIAMSSIEPVSVKALLDQVIDSPVQAALSCEDALQLGLTITSAFLQLYPTDWIGEAWSTDNILLLREASTRAVDPAYVTMVTSPDQAHGPQTGSRSNDGPKLLALASIILELGLDRKLNDLRGKRDGPGMFFTIQRWLQKQGSDSLDEVPQCFRETATYCLDKYVRDLDLKNAAKQQEIADALVYPFLRDLRHSQERLPPELVA